MILLGLGKLKLQLKMNKKEIKAQAPFKTEVSF